MKTISSYPEKGADPVMTLTASDPEGATPIVWSKLEAIGSPAEQIDGEALTVGEIEDFGDFKISQGGVLPFARTPNFEAPADDTPGDNEYHVVVQASDGATMNTLNWFKVTVKVTDVEEEGSIKLRPTTQVDVDDVTVTLLQPQVGVDMAAHSLTDPDGVSDTDHADSTITTAEYKWYMNIEQDVDGDCDRR